MTNILALLNDEERQLYKTIRLTKEETLFHEDDLCEEIGIIVEGQVAIISYLDDGKEMVFNRLDKGGIFGNNLIFSSSPYYKGNVIAQSENEIALLKKDDLFKLLESNSDFMIEYLKILSDQGKQLNAKIRLLSLASAQDRFIYYMYDHKKQITYTSLNDLAKDLYLSRETLSRLLSRMSSEKRIKKQGKTLRLL